MCKLMHNKYAHTSALATAQHEKMHLMSELLRSAVAVLKLEALNCTLQVVPKHITNQSNHLIPPQQVHPCDTNIITLITPHNVTVKWQHAFFPCSPSTFSLSSLACQHIYPYDDKHTYHSHT